VAKKKVTKAELTQTELYEKDRKAYLAQSKLARTPEQLAVQRDRLTKRLEDSLKYNLGSAGWSVASAIEEYIDDVLVARGLVKNKNEVNSEVAKA
jgi:hypothetical protein